MSLKNYELRKYKKSDKDLWDGFIEKAKNSSFLFQRDFMEYHADRFVDHSLLIFENSELLAVLPAHLQGSVLYSHQGLSYGGLVLAEAITFPQVKDIFEKILNFLAEKGIGLLHLKLLPKIYHRLPSDEIDYLLFLTQATLLRRDLSSAVFNENKLPITSSNRLRGIKKARKNGLIVKDEADFGLFWKEVLEPNLLESHGKTPVHSLNEIRGLKQQFPQNIRQFSVYEDDKIIAGTTLFETFEVVHAQYISANARGRKLGALDFLFDYLLQEFSDKRYFDFGISNEMQGQKLNKGLNAWKEGFGARSIVHDFYEVRTENHQLLKSIYL